MAEEKVPVDCTLLCLVLPWPTNLLFLLLPQARHFIPPVSSRMFSVTLLKDFQTFWERLDLRGRVKSDCGEQCTVLCVGAKSVLTVGTCVPFDDSQGHITDSFSL